MRSKYSEPTDNEEELTETLSTGTYNVESHCPSRNYQPNTQKWNTPEASQQQFGPANREIDKLRREMHRGEEISSRQLWELKEKAYLFEYDMMQLRSENKQLKESLAELLKTNELFYKLLEKQALPTARKEFKSKSRMSKDSKTSKSGKLKKVRSQQFLGVPTTKHEKRHPKKTTGRIFQ